MRYRYNYVRGMCVADLLPSSTTTVLDLLTGCQDSGSASNEMALDAGERRASAGTAASARASPPVETLYKETPPPGARESRAERAPRRLCSRTLYVGSVQCQCRSKDRRRWSPIEAAEEETRWGRRWWWR